MNFNPTENNPKGASSGDLRSNNAAFETFFKEHYSRLCVYCSFKYGFDSAVAEDIVMTSFTKLWEGRHNLDANISPKSYLYKIVENSSVNLLKHESVKQQHAHYLLRTTSECIENLSFDSVDLRQLRTAIDAAILELPEQMRRIFELSRFEDLKYSQIATQLNISIKTVETQMSRALSKLREKLSAYYPIWFIVLLLSPFLKK